ncbi:hypothetical protein Desor_5411 [Desulfosporosinus orientis DSM 765]|uniref:Uncharacterized protein n=1 Tax=Desulfosporosinus orientis (strain ATCC 19365 / DSM 765 / NCIMB 8382 / VKM B-1628 / Singapore I) TaxID=768706 RepID=G7WEH4_DESOD|nr:hypothetical protein Desor_5411 [Desulfosporosinus orientis DSM 765]
MIATLRDPKTTSKDPRARLLRPQKRTHCMERRYKPPRRCGAAQPVVHIRYYPVVWRSSRTGEEASLGMLGTRRHCLRTDYPFLQTLSSHELAFLRGCGETARPRSTPFLKQCLPQSIRRSRYNFSFHQQPFIQSYRLPGFNARFHGRHIPCESEISFAA